MTRLRTKLNSAGILKTGTNLYCNFDSLNLFDLFNGLLGIEKWKEKEKKKGGQKKQIGKKQNENALEFDSRQGHSIKITKDRQVI